MEVEYRNMRKSELSEGQATAMRCALEERKRMLLETQIRMDTEAKDAQFARCAHDEEADFLAKCSRDDEYARQLYDEQCAELLQENEEKEALLLKERIDIDSAADEKVREIETVTFTITSVIIFGLRSSSNLSIITTF